MLKRHLLFLALIIPFGFLLPAQPPREAPGFYMRNFFISLDISSVTMNGTAIRRSQWQNPQSPLGKIQGRFSGKGFIRIHNIKVPVKFIKVEITKDPVDDAFTAVSGAVLGLKPGCFERIIHPRWRNLNYALNDFRINIDNLSIKITVDSAVAVVSAGLRDPAFFTDDANSVWLKSNSCKIDPNGAIEGNNFHGSTAFEFKDSVYRLKLDVSDAQFVRLGGFRDGVRVRGGTLPPNTPDPLVEIKGIATRENIELFSFTGSIKPSERTADFSLRFLGPMDRIPEPGYELSLLSGYVNYQYDASGIVLCEGSFRANLKLPNTIRAADDGTIDLPDLTLKTDRDGVLFNNITMADTIKAGYAGMAQLASSIFLIEPKPESAWVYFPIWHRIQHSSYQLTRDGRKLTIDSSCKELYDLLEIPLEPDPDGFLINAYRRPGLTIHRGILYFRAPQAKFDSNTPTSPYNLKAPFWGAVTGTPWGMTGVLTSSGASFIPSNSRIEDSSVPVQLNQYTLEEIIGFGNNRPPEPNERFSLAGFQIAAMQADQLRLCKNELHESSFRYLVHFPFPSYIDLEFEDTTLDETGKFHRALGPIAPFSYEFTQGESPSATEAGSALQPKYATGIVYNLVSQIFFAWRLPVSFSHHGVVINYKNPPERSEATILMNQGSSDNENIMSSELRVVPLFSGRSDMRYGVRFKGKVTTDGKFTLIDWDREPFFSKLHPELGREKTVGFATQALDIVLADYQDNPATRPYDHKWDGQIQFPFFSWQTSAFSIKDQVPKKEAPVSFSATNGGCDVEGIELNVNRLDYTFDSLTPFTSDDFEAFEIDQENRRSLNPISLSISAYLNGLVLLGNPDTTIIVNPFTTIENATRSSYILDLACYDDEALTVRQDYNIPGECCEEYYIGTAYIKDSNGKILMSAKNTKYYQGVASLALNATTMALLSEDSSTPKYDTKIDIPGAQLAIGDDGSLYGDFGATFTPIAMMLPYEGEFRFFINPDESDFYVQIAGTFSYYLRFRGELFIVHAPLSALKQPPTMFLGATNILDDLSQRALFTNTGAFLDVVELDNLTDDTKITGFITAANAQKNFDLIEYVITANIASGPGVYAYNFSSSSGSGHNWGTFFNVKAKASVLLLSLNGGGMFDGGITAGEFKVGGRFDLYACATAFIGHCEAGVVGEAKFSSGSGFDFSGCNACAHCDTGGCSGCP